MASLIIQTFMTFSIGCLQFIDRFEFMASSLDRLVSNLYDKADKFKHFERWATGNDFPLENLVNDGTTRLEN